MVSTCQSGSSCGRSGCFLHRPPTNYPRPLPCAIHGIGIGLVVESAVSGLGRRRRTRFEESARRQLTRIGSYRRVRVPDTPPQTAGNHWGVCHRPPESRPDAVSQGREGHRDGDPILLWGPDERHDGQIRGPFTRRGRHSRRLTRRGPTVLGRIPHRRPGYLAGPGLDSLLECRQPGAARFVRRKDKPDPFHNRRRGAGTRCRSTLYRTRRGRHRLLTLRRG